MTHAIGLHKPLPATAAAVDLTALFIIFSTIFDVVRFVSGFLTSFLNLGINLGLFFFGEIL